MSPGKIGQAERFLEKRSLVTALAAPVEFEKFQVLQFHQFQGILLSCGKHALLCSALANDLAHKQSLQQRLRACSRWPVKAT